MAIRKTHEQFQEELFNLTQNEFVLVDTYVNQRTKIKVFHVNCQKDFLILPSALLKNKNKCPYCYKGTKKSLDDFKKEIIDLTENEYELLDNQYKNNRTPVSMIHHTCGNIFSTTRDRFINGGNRCPLCAKTSLKSNEKFLEEVYNLVKDEYTFLEKYINSNTKIKVRHNICQHIYDITPGKFLSGSRCPECAKNKKWTHAIFLEKVKTVIKDENEYSFLEEYQNSHTKIKVKHNTCGYIYDITPSSFIRGHFCPKCAGNLKKTDSEFRDVVYDLTQDEYTFLDPYVSTNVNIKVQHNICKNIYEVSPSNFITKNSRCPFCQNFGTSHQEKSLYNYISTLIKPEDILLNDRKLLNKKEIDILIPSKNIGIEFDGLYWHSSKYKDKNFHLNKTQLAKQKNVQLIHIFEDEWTDKQDLIKIKLSHILGVNPQKKIFARKCEVKKIVNSSEKTQFLKETHIQGPDRANFAYGLYYENELIALMSFITPRINMGRKDANEGEYELSRYSTKYNIIGGFGKLLKYCIKQENIKEIYTYADLRWTNPDNNIYLKNGFEYISTSTPNYWYLVNGKRENRFNYQKAKLKEKFPDIYSDSKTEEQIMLELGYYRIYDCGHLKYKMKVEESLNDY